MPRGRRNRFASRAALEALLRFGPELSGLADLQRSAESEFTQSVRGARGAARGTTQAIRQARPQVRDIYHDAKGATEDAQAVVGADMANVPASLRAAMTQEQTGYGNRLREERADALTDLSSRAVAAQEGKGAAIRAARDQLAGSLQQILQHRLDLAGQQGAFTQLRTSELADEAQKRADQFALKQMGLSQSERNSLRSSGVDPDTGKPIPGGPLDDKGGKGGKNRATRAQIGTAQDVTQSALSEVRTLQKLGASRAEIAQLLRSGAKEQEIPIHDPKTGKPKYNPDGTPMTKKVPGLPQIKSDLLLSAALDQRFNGYVTEQVRRKLHRRGIYLVDLGLTNVRDWRRRPRTGGSPSQGAAGYPYGPGAGSVH